MRLPSPPQNEGKRNFMGQNSWSCEWGLVNFTKRNLKKRPLKTGSKGWNFASRKEESTLNKCKNFNFTETVFMRKCKDLLSAHVDLREQVITGSFEPILEIFLWNIVQCRNFFKGFFPGHTKPLLTHYSLQWPTWTELICEIVRKELHFENWGFKLHSVVESVYAPAL